MKKVRLAGTPESFSPEICGSRVRQRFICPEENLCRIDFFITRKETSSSFVKITLKRCSDSFKISSKLFDMSIAKSNILSIEFSMQKRSKNELFELEIDEIEVGSNSISLLSSPSGFYEGILIVKSRKSGRKRKSFEEIFDETCLVLELFFDELDESIDVSTESGNGDKGNGNEDEEKQEECFSLFDDGVTELQSLSFWIVIPTYNRCNELKGTLRAIPFDCRYLSRVIVVDDGSTDDTKLVVKSFGEEKLDYIYHKHEGVNAARRIGAGYVPEDAIVIENDDHDLMISGTMEKFYKAFLNPDIHFVYGDCTMVNESGIEIELSEKPNYVRWQFRDGRCYSGGIRAYRKILYDAVGGWRLDEFPAGDYAFALRAEKYLNGVGFYRVKSPLTKVKVSSNSISAVFKNEQHKAAISYKQKAKDGTLRLAFENRNMRCGGSRPKIGIVSPWAYQGLTRMAVQLGKLIHSMNFDWSVFVYEKYQEDIYPEHREKLVRDNFEQWVLDKSCVIYLEFIKFELSKHTSTLPTVLVPMWEWFFGETLINRDIVDLIVAPTRCSFDFLVSDGTRNVRYNRWFIDDPFVYKKKAVNGKIKLFHNGSMPRKRRHTHTLLESFYNILVDGRIDLHLTLKMQCGFDEEDPEKVGGCADEGKYYYDVLLNNFPNNFTPIMGRFEKEENDILYDNFDVFMYTSESDGIGLMVQEAALHSMPLVVPDVSPVRDLIDEGVSGIVFPVESAVHERSGCHMANITVSAVTDALSMINKDTVSKLFRKKSGNILRRWQKEWERFWTNLIRDLS